MPYRLLALDLDGTTIGRDLAIVPETRAALERFQARGGRVTLATGRMAAATIPFAKALGVDGPLICYQGAMIVDHHTGAVLAHDPVPPALAAEAVQRLLADHVYVHAYINEALYVPWQGREIELFLRERLVQLEVHLVDDLASMVAEHPPTKLLFIDEEHRVAPRIAGLQTHFTDRLHVVRSHAMFGELTATGITKGRALAQLAAMLRVPQAQTAAAGDQANDIEMVAWAGLGMAVRSGPPELLAVADVLIDEPDQIGLARGIEQYLLGE